MDIIILIAVIVVLVVAHEFGHLIVAKLSGMRVDEFGIGYPPRALALGTIGETTYTLNWIPFGGFVKIYGEDLNSEVRDPRAFASKNRFKQALVLVAGITMNLVLAYVLITAALVMGTPRALDQGELGVARDVQLIVADVVPGSPAAVAGLMPGDTIQSAVTPMAAWQEVDPQSFTNFISTSSGRPVKVSVIRNGGAVSVTATPEQGLIERDPGRYALGVQVVTIGIVPLSFTEALAQGAELTWQATRLTAIGLANFFYSIFTFSANLSQVSGPVGIAGAVGGASAQGFGSLLSIMAIISINLALINLIPIPALDGGRLLFVIIESVTRRPIKQSVAQTINSIGFVFLLLLMLAVTAHDIFKLVG